MGFVGAHSWSFSTFCKSWTGRHTILQLNTSLRCHFLDALVLCQGWCRELATHSCHCSEQLQIRVQAEVFGNGSAVYGPEKVTCISAATVLSNTAVEVSPSNLSAGSQATVSITPRVSCWHPSSQDPTFSYGLCKVSAIEVSAIRPQAPQILSARSSVGLQDMQLMHSWLCHSKVFDNLWG